MTGEEPETAATFTFDRDYTQGIKWNKKPPHLDFEEGDELVRRCDHEEVVEKRVQQERQKILDKIDDKIQKLIDRANKAEEKGVEVDLDVAMKELGEVKDEVSE